MKLDRALEIGRGMNLPTIGERYANIVIHAPNMFTYDSINTEIGELNDEMKSEATRLKLSSDDFENMMVEEYLLTLKDK